jgi:hypothetical protein
MAWNWKKIGGLSALLIATAVIGCMFSVLVREISTNAFFDGAQANRLLPLVTGFGANTALPIDPRLRCVALPTGIRLSSRPTTKDWMDRYFHGTADWTAISDRMKPGDDVYAYDNIPRPPSGVIDFIGLGGGYVVLRRSCLIGRFGTWVE